MLNYNRFLLIAIIFTNITGCTGFKKSMKELGNSMKKFENDISGRSAEKEKVKEYRDKRAAANLANAKGFNFHNYDVIGFKTGKNSEYVKSFIRKNTTPSSSHSGFKQKYTSQTSYYKKDGAVIIGTTGIVEHDTAYYITRLKEYDYLTGPISDDLKKQLFKKYGPPTIIFTHEPDNYIGVGKQRYYKNKYGKTVPEFFVTEYYWQFDKNGNLLPRNEKLGYATSDTREYFTTTEMIKPPTLPARMVYNRFHVTKCDKNCSYQLTAAVNIRHYDNADRVIRYSITLADMVLLDKLVTKAKVKKETNKKEQLKKKRLKNMQIDL